MCCQLVGDSGSTVVEESQTVVDEVEFTEVRLSMLKKSSWQWLVVWSSIIMRFVMFGGMQGLSIDRGYVSPYFVKDQERQVPPTIASVFDEGIGSVSQWVGGDSSTVMFRCCYPSLQQLAELRKPRVSVTEGKISAVHEILPLLEHIAKRYGAILPPLVFGGRDGN